MRSLVPRYTWGTRKALCVPWYTYSTNKADNGRPQRRCKMRCSGSVHDRTSGIVEKKARYHYEDGEVCEQACIIFPNLCT